MSKDKNPQDRETEPPEFDESTEYRDSEAASPEASTERGADGPGSEPKPPKVNQPNEPSDSPKRPICDLAGGRISNRRLERIRRSLEASLAKATWGIADQDNGMDAVQQTLFEIWKRYPGMLTTPKSNDRELANLARRIFRNQMVNECRNKKRWSKRHVFDSTLTALAWFDTDVVDDSPTEESLFDELNEILDLVPDLKQRAVLELSLLGFPATKTADVLGLKPADVRQTLRRARIRVCRELSARGDSPTSIARRLRLTAQRVLLYIRKDRQSEDADEETEE